ncbi:hypothetical protein ACYT7O_10695, partial [Streptococcus pyogenes]
MEVGTAAYCLGDDRQGNGEHEVHREPGAVPHAEFARVEVRHFPHLAFTARAMTFASIAVASSA